MAKKGKSLERLVELLEHTWADKTAVLVESPMKMIDKRTGRLREHDVGVTIRQQHHSIVLALECRDRSRPVGVGQVEAFHQKCLDTGIDKGAIVSTTGFCDTARIKAEAYGIRCLDIESATNFDWLQTDVMKQQSVTVTKQAFTCIPAVDVGEKPTSFNVIDPQGNLVPMAVLQANLTPHIQALTPHGVQSGTYSKRIRFKADGFSIQDKISGRQIPIASIVAEVEVLVKVWTEPFRLSTYSDKAGKLEISQVARIPVGSGELEGELVFVHKPEEGTQVLFVPNRKKPEQ